MMLSSALLNAIILISSVGATPILDKHDGSLKARIPPIPPMPQMPPMPPQPPQPLEPQPGIAEFKEQFEEIAPDSCLFYSGVGAEDAVVDERDKRDYLGSYSILDERWLNHNWVNDRLDNVIGGTHQFFRTASAALSQECSGVVYVFLPSDTSGLNFPQRSIWVSDEWPNLQDGTRVTKVVRLKIDDPSHQETIFETSAPGHKKRGGDDDDSQQQCSIRLTQWEEENKTDQDDASDKYGLEFDVKNARGNVIGHQAKVDVAMWDPLNWLGGGLLPGGLVIIPSGDKLFFWHRGAFWRSDDSRCQVGGWVNGEGEARNRELNCRFTC